uniref:P-loop containing nucleoside triphosphate hydrolase protein n=1 Tax=Parastrongyloides trichosuri TaxID=131310 RepID=A0A0N5A418_PARTI
MTDNTKHRLVVLGSSKVGKTSIIKRYLYQEFTDKYKETVEDLHSRRFMIHGSELNLDILDTNFNFPDMRKVAISSASAFMIVFSVDNVQSFKEMSDLWNEITSIRNDISNIPTVFVGNKSDMESKKIFEATANAWVSRLNSKVKYIEASAKNNINIIKIFKSLLDLSGFALQAIAEQEELQNAANDVKNNSPGGFLRRVGSMKKNNQDGKMLEKVREGAATPLVALTTQLSTPTLGISGDINMLRRNRSLRIVPGKDTHDKDSSKSSDIDHKPASRSGSLIRRTKHLSLKGRKSNDKNLHQHVDESDCIIS